jgi:cobalt/nickel transport system permease protein
VGKGPRIALPAAFLCGSLSVFLAGILVALALTFTEENFLKASYLVVMAHLPVMIIEGIITAFCVAFLKKVQPDMLPGKTP